MIVSQAISPEPKQNSQWRILSEANRKMYMHTMAYLTGLRQIHRTQGCRKEINPQGPSWESPPWQQKTGNQNRLVYMCHFYAELLHGDRLHSSNVLCLNRRPLKTQCNERSSKKKNKIWAVHIECKIHCLISICQRQKKKIHSLTR